MSTDPEGMVIGFAVVGSMAFMTGFVIGVLV
jgi:hypothetical protein